MKIPLVSILLWMALLSPARAAEENLFQDRVALIFERHCVGCHEGAKPKGGLSLVNRAGLLAGGENGPAIVPGKPDESLLLDYITGDEPLMPKGGKRLAADEVAAIRKWIEAGAAWPAELELVDKRLNDTNWWSLEPLRRPAVPRVEQVAASAPFPIRNPIDAFVFARLKEKGLSPSPPADRQTLIRRLYYDLIGLPPPRAEVEAFVADADPLAYEKLIDRLLASPQYGERWGRHWLDVVHYGETHGYDKDKPRPQAWPYRDYVIASFNQDKHYTRFVQEQLAADRLFPNEPASIVALGFISAGPWDFIGHAEVSEDKTDGKIARLLDRDDMVSNAMNTFSSTTVQCARCHNHKFDPITQDDYYALQAVFAALDRANVKYDADATVASQRVELKQVIAELSAQANAFQAEAMKLAGDKLVEIDREIKLLTAAKTADPTREAAFGYHSQLSDKPNVTKWVQVDLGQAVELSRVVLHACQDDFNQIGAGFGFPARFRVEVANDAEFKTDVKVIGDYTQANFPNPRLTPVSISAAGSAFRYIRVTATQLALRQNDYMLALAEIAVWDAAGTNVSAGKTVTALDSIEAHPRWRMTNVVDQYYPGQILSADPEKLAQLQLSREQLLETSLEAARRAEWKDVEAKLSKAEANYARLPVQSEVYIGTVYNGAGAFKGTGASGGKPRPIHVLSRGDVRKPLQLVGPGVPPLLSGADTRFPITDDQPESERRAALAKWITDPQHPLTWRSAVNRIWQYHFGRGIVDSSNDFGRMGSLPSHPELLDWLAVEFLERGQSFKAMHRLICASSTYRQASAEIESHAVIDSDNVYLWRMNRRRLEAEAMRDSVLAAAGKLDLTMGGPGFQDFVIERPEHSPHYEYKLFDPEDPRSHRRSVYRFIVRSQPQPFMTTLDCADPSLSVDKRNESISALQSLALMNNKFMVAMASHFAARLEKEAPDLPSQIDHAFWLCLSRAPTASERENLIAYAEEFGLPNTCRVLFNLNELAFID